LIEGDVVEGELARTIGDEMMTLSSNRMVESDDCIRHQGARRIADDAGDCAVLYLRVRSDKRGGYQEKDRNRSICDNSHSAKECSDWRSSAFEPRAEANRY
jgi:hypothetical protein